MSSSILTGKAPRFRLGGTEGSPGIGALQARDKNFMHPTSIPVGAGFEGLLGIPGTTATGQAVPITGEAIKPIDPYELQEGDIFTGDWAASTGDYGGKFGVLSRPQLSGIKKVDRAQQAYSDAFRKDYYDPYLETIFKNPIDAAIIKTGDVGSGLTPSQTGTAEAGALLTPISDVLVGGQQSIPDELASQYTGSTGPLGTPAILTSQTGELKSAGEDYGDAMGDYTREMDLLTDEEELAKDVKAEGMRNINLQRKEELKPYLSEQEQRQANIAATGMAYSAPAQQRAALEQGQTTTGLKDLTLQKRQIQKDYDTDIKRIEEGRTDVEGALGDAQSAYGSTLASLADSAASELGSATQWLADIQESHSKVGEAFEAGYRMPNIQEAGGVKLLEGDKGKHYQRMGYNAPEGGWYGEEGYAHPSQESAMQQLEAVAEFQKWLKTFSGGEIAPYLPQPTTGG